MNPLWFFLTLLFAGTCEATKGREFVVAFYEHFRSGHIPEIFFIFLSDSNTTVHVESSGFSIFEDVFVQEMTETKYTTDADNYYQANLDVTDMSFHITSTQDMTLFCYNYMATRGDGFLALPFPALSTNYILVTHSDDDTSDISVSLLYTGTTHTVFLVLATQDNTQVTITLKIKGTNAAGGCDGGSFLDGQTRTFTLNKYQVLGAYCDDDITGSKVVSDKPVAVLSGHNYKRMLSGANADHLTEMLLPVQSFGRNFVLTDPPEQTLGALYRVVGSEAATDVHSSTGLTFSVGEGEHHDIDVDSSTGPMYIEATKPVMVVQFAKSRASMTIVPSTNLYSSSYALGRANLNHPGYSSVELKYFYITVVVPTDKVLGLRPEIFPQFEVIKGSCFAYVTLEVDIGYHRVTHTDGVPFGVIVYPVAYFKGFYSHPGGYNLTDVVDENLCSASKACSDGIPYQCSCSTGYFDYNCTDTSTGCTNDPCKYSSTCNELITSYICTCVNGTGGAHCETDLIDNCVGHTCINGACVDMMDAYTCNCAGGYTGTNCETDINECASDPCINGTCVNVVNDYTCNCDPGNTGKNCDTEINECDSSPCQNGGSCTDLFDGFECSCLDGTNGTLCEFDMDECLSDPCKNGGTCNDFISYYNCSCAQGYEGTDCETDIDECLSDPCQNGGTCSHFINFYNCSCALGYEGTNCETDIDDCLSNPCQNSGTCNDFPNFYNCTCVPGYQGTDCETDIDECASNPCVNGNCNNYVNLYNCTCTPGYEGDLCDTEVNECDSNPCQNGGDCKDLFNAFECACSPGYNGSLCDNEIDECSGQPCLNGGNCTDGVNGYNCTCPDGIDGTNCEQVSCALSPCENNATCTDSDTGFKCACVPGFEGENCETDINDCASSPCKNDGTCVDKINTFQCLCPAKFTGTLCQLLLNCGCPCRFHNITDAYLISLINWWKSTLLLDKSKLSKQIRQKTSAPDDRPSSTGIGASGITCLVITFGFFVLMDGLNILKLLTTKKQVKEITRKDSCGQQDQTKPESDA